MVKRFFILPACLFLCLSLAFSVCAVTISNVAVSDDDTFYSGYAANSVIHLRVNITDVNSTPGNTVSVTANFVSLDVNCAGSGTSLVNLANTAGNVWETTCDVSSEAGAMPLNTFKSGQILIIANETYGPSSVNTNLTLSLYNIAVRSMTFAPTSGKSCYRFGEGSTNFNEITNFNNMDVTLIIEINDDSQCVGSGYNWDWLKVAELKFVGVNFNNNAADAQKLCNLFDIVALKFSPPNAYQNTRLTVNTSLLPELNVNPFNIKLYHLFFITPLNEFIVSDNSVSAEVINWTSNGVDSAVGNYNTYNLAFTVNRGFKGYTITDSVPPLLSLDSMGTVFNTTTILINTTINGTGTGVSRALFYINGVSNNATCTILSPETSNCFLSIIKGDGSYNLSILAYDYGNTSGNAARIDRSFVVNSSAPALVVKSPSDGKTYSGTDGSMLKLNFSASDGNGISSCLYELNDDEAVDVDDCSAGNVVQLYLADGNYDLDVYAKDTLGRINTSSISFTVSDSKAPVITNNTKLSNKNVVVMSVITDEKASCRYDDSDVSYAKMNEEFKDSLTIHNATMNLDEKGVIYTYYVRCTDVSGNSNDESFKVYLYYGNASNATAVNVTRNVTKQDPSESITLDLLSSGKNIMAFEKESNPLYSLALATNTLKTDVTIKVISVSKPAETYSGSKNIYKYFSVEHESLGDAYIDDVNITFKVSKAWLMENSINKDDVLLMRFSKIWNRLNTSMVREDSDNVYYTANSPGLSLFVIAAKDKDVIINTTVVETSRKDSATNTSNYTSNSTSAAAKLLSGRHYNWTWVIILSILVFVILVLFVLVQRNDKLNPPIFPEDRTIFGRIRRLFK